MRAASLVTLVLFAVARAAAAVPLILISLDGFRWDYCDEYASQCPTLRQWRDAGVTTDGLIPAFPSNTFPNHYTLVTGLRPTSHGIVNNDFFDAGTGRFFRYTQRAIAGDPHWWGGEPIWVTAILQGRKAAAAFWVGSEAAIKGVRPTQWRVFDYRMPFEERLNELTDWLTRPAGERPEFVAFYLEEANGAGHAHGPDTPQVAAAVNLLDQRLRTMRERLMAAGIEPNFVIVSDHGMTRIDHERVAILEKYIPAAEMQVDFDGAVAGLRPRNGDVDTLLRRARTIPHSDAYRVEELPAHLRIAAGPRVPPVWILAREGAQVVTRATFERLSTRYRPHPYLPGDHGYDPALRSMHGFFLAYGPAFRRGVRLPAAENVHVYNLLCATLGLKPAANDGDDRLLQALRHR